MIAEIKTFEVYCEKFSRIIQSIDIITAIMVFRGENPNDAIVSIEDVNYRESPPSSSIEQTLLDFCHFLGKEGYKINGYDDSQLLAVIKKFSPSSIEQDQDELWKDAVEVILENDYEPLAYIIKILGQKGFHITKKQIGNV